MTNGETGALTSAAEVIRRARRRAFRWGIASSVLWALVGIGAFGIVNGYFVYIHPYLCSLLSKGPNLSEEELKGLRMIMRCLPNLVLVPTTIWAALVVMAGVGTLMYVASSRQATLAHIQEGLRDLSDQLQKIVETPPPRSA